MWLGAWGGSGSDGVVMQPVIAELFIHGPHADLAGFPNVGSISGSARLDAALQTLTLFTGQDQGPNVAATLVVNYELNGDELTLTFEGQPPITFHRQPAIRLPEANVNVELVTATDLNDAGDLLVTEYTRVLAGSANLVYYQPRPRTLSTRRASVLQIRDGLLHPVSMDEARAMIANPTPIVPAFYDEASPANPLYQLWRDSGQPRPDDDAVRRTLLALVRPGTMIFILSAQENIPVP
jgi:hypothetical protein